MHLLPSRESVREQFSAMAARRISKSAVDWIAFAERVPQAQKDAFRAFKAKSDAFITK